jgi:hypothetical protein
VTKLISNFALGTTGLLLILNDVISDGAATLDVGKHGGRSLI